MSFGAWLPREYGWSRRLLIILAIISSGLMALIYFPPGPFPQADNVLVPALMASYVYTTGLLLLMLARVAQRAATLTARERRSTVRWELFALTGLDARRYMYTNWWAAVRPMVRPWVVLVLVRAAVAVALVMAHNVLFTGSMTVSELPPITTIVLAYVSLVIGALALLPFAGAVGVVAGVTSQRTPGHPLSTIASWVLLAVGTLLVALMFVQVNVTLAGVVPYEVYFFTPTYINVNNLLVAIGATVADATVFSLIQHSDTMLIAMSTSLDFLFDPTPEVTVLALLFTGVVLVAWTFGLLGFSRWLAVQHGMISAAHP